MDIAALSMGLSQMKISQQVNVSVMKMAMDSAQTQTADLTQMINDNTRMMEMSINPHIGGSIDIKL